jgi:Fe-S-cluster containining protein
MPADRGKAVLHSCLETAKGILDRMPEDFDIKELAQTDSEIQINRLSGWYTGLKLACPFLLDSLCTMYEQRPLACREHIVTGSAASCDLEKADELQIVQMPVSVLECLGRLTAELEQSDVEAVMLPLALPWAQKNIVRSRRTWPAVTMVERFIEILEAMARNIPTPTQSRV